MLCCFKCGQAREERVCRILPPGEAAHVKCPWLGRVYQVLTLKFSRAQASTLCDEGIWWGSHLVLIKDGLVEVI